jgi:hypothetical protein
MLLLPISHICRIVIDRIILMYMAVACISIGHSAAHLSNLLLGTPELGLQREYHIDVHASRWRRPVLDQRSLIIIQQVHVIVGGCRCRGTSLLLHPSLLLHRDHRSDVVEVFISLRLDRFFPHLLRPHPLDPPPLAGREA